MMNLSPEAKFLRAHYMREWRKKHPEKQKEYDARYWEKQATKYKENKPSAGEPE